MKYRIRDIAPMSNKTINPQCEPNTIWHLYSLPSFDNGKRENVLGKEIKSNKFVVPNRCILYNKLNVRFKRVWCINSDEDHLIASTEFLPLVPNEDLVDYNYLYQLLISDQLTNYFNNQNSNTSGSHKRIDVDSFLDLEIDLPSPDVQKRIGKLISINNKIALNTRMIAELEAMAKQIYDYWFVQFDFPDENGTPYKSSGGKMVYNEKLKREIPEGWEDCELKDITEIVNGATPLTSDSANYGNEIVWITPNDLSNQNSKFINCGERSITQKGYDSCSTTLMPEGSVLMSSRAPIGLLAIAEVELCTNQGFKSFVPYDMIDNYFIYYYIQEHMPQIEQLGAGTTFREVSRDTMSHFPILKIKDRRKYKKWYEEIDNICMMQKNLLNQINDLTHLRDSLLPMLMNGQVTVE